MLSVAFIINKIWPFYNFDFREIDVTNQLTIGANGISHKRNACVSSGSEYTTPNFSLPLKQIAF